MRLALPSGPTNSYVFPTVIHGILRRSAASASRARNTAFSFARSCSRAASHSCRDTIGGVFSMANLLFAELRDARRELFVVFVVMTQPKARLVAPLRRAVEPLIHAPKAVEPARIGRVGVVDRRRLRARMRSCPAVLARTSRHRLRPAPRPWRPGHLRRGAPAASRGDNCTRMFAVPLLQLADRGVEVDVEVAAEGRSPGKRPAHPPFVGLELGDRRARTAHNMTSWLARWTAKPLKPSAIAEHDGQPAAKSGPNMKW